MPYTEVNISGYNAAPPTDDGSTDSVNTITWAKIKEKLGDPLNTGIADLDDNVATACNTLDSDIVALEASISALTGDISGEDGALTAPAATELFFVQTAAPTGWTKDTTHNNKAIRLVAGTISTGGSTAFTSILTSRTIAAANLPSHTHTIDAQTGKSLTLARTSWTNDADVNTSGMTSGGNNRYKSLDNTSAAIAATITHSGTTGSSGSGSAMDFAIQYVDIILAIKD